MASPKYLATGMSAALLACVLGSSPVPVSAQSVEGEVITLVSPNSAGGMMTRYARMIAPYIAKYSGARDVRIRVMTGGGGIRGTNYVWFSEPDGRTIAFTSIPSLILAQLAGSEAAQFDATELTYLGRAATEPRVLTVGATSAIMTIADARSLNRQFIFPSQGTDEDFYSMAVLSNALDIELKVVSGYDGNADTALAVIKGDGDGHITGWSASIAVIEAGDERPILTLSRERIADYPDIPTATELVSGESREAVEAIVNMLDMRRGFFGPPGMDPQAMSELRTAISAAFQDPDLIAESMTAGLPLLPSDGLSEQAKIDQITVASQNLVPILRSALDAIR
ncbi:MAG: Bug family tripartite tricarboxylate transporter substrate binding protein [Candidatus Rariloculaceae bacterium]